MQVGGFVGTGYPEYLVDAIRQRFDKTGHPRQLKLFMVALVGDGKGRGMDALAVDSLVDSLVFAWTGLSPKYLELIKQNKVLGWNLPLGVSKNPGPPKHFFTVLYLPSFWILCKCLRKAGKDLPATARKCKWNLKGRRASRRALLAGFGGSQPSSATLK